MFFGNTERYTCSVDLCLPVLPIILLGPVEVIALGEHEAFQVPVLSPLLQPLLFQDGHQSVSFLHRPHNLRQDLLLLLQFGGALFCVCRQRGEDMEAVYYITVNVTVNTNGGKLFLAAQYNLNFYLDTEAYDTVHSS